MSANERVDNTLSLFGAAIGCIIGLTLGALSGRFVGDRVGGLLAYGIFIAGGFVGSWIAKRFIDAEKFENGIGLLYCSVGKHDWWIPNPRRPQECRRCKAINNTLGD